MKITLIRKKLVEIICSYEYCENWIEILQNTNPANYGLEDIQINVSDRDVWINVPKRTFIFKNTEISFSVRLAGSNKRNGYDANFNKEVSGQGQFEFIKNRPELIITGIEINNTLDLY